MESIPLNTIVRNRQRTEEEEPSEDNKTTESRTKPTIDVHNITGLITILTVNIHQLESLLQVGTDLGYKFWLNITLVIISLVCVYPLLILRMLQGEGYATSPRRCWVGLMVIIFTINVTLQIFNDLEAQCTILLKQPLPPVELHSTSNGSV